MTTPTRHDITMVAGDSLDIVIETREPDSETPVDISGWDCWLTVKQFEMQADNEAAVQIRKTVPDNATDGTYVLEVKPEDTVSTQPGTYQYDIQLVSPDKSSVATLVRGTFNLQYGVTQGY